MMNTEKRYLSKVDWWMGLILILMVLSALSSLIFGALKLGGETPSEGWRMIRMGVFVGGSLGLLMWPIHYTLTEEQLVIRFGVFKMRLGFETITGVVPSKSPLSAPALSLDRLKVSHSGFLKMALISPTDKVAFMEDLAGRCAHLEYAEGVVRAVEASAPAEEAPAEA